MMALKEVIWVSMPPSRLPLSVVVFGCRVGLASPKTAPSNRAQVSRKQTSELGQRKEEQSRGVLIRKGSKIFDSGMAVV